MPTTPAPNAATKKSPAHVPPTEKIQGHWLLARLGKKVLRPGGRELTNTMLGSLDVRSTDKVVEFAPGIGATAKALIERGPASYTAVDADEDAATTVGQVVAPSGGKVIVGRAQHVPLDDGDATVVVGEAMLTMQSETNKSAVVAEAARLLSGGGRYAIHELCITPDDLDDATVQKIWDDLSRTIHVGARPLTTSAWRELLEEQGFKVTAEHHAPMALLEPKRIIADEGLLATLKFFFGIAIDAKARKRVREMRACFNRWSDHMAAVAFVAEMPKPQAA
ncbi:MAG: class I SAM-dependent methyltransferase [Acidimicrobiales bacterium]|nr:class I SAM-dependent methyltransferase [Acidimicrobiales bacterium]